MDAFHSMNNKICATMERYNNNFNKQPTNSQEKVTSSEEIVQEVPKKKVEAFEVFECEVSGCLYSTERQDNMKRHLKQTHENYKVACSNCGTMVRPSSMKRHKRSSSCLLKTKIALNSHNNADEIEVKTIIKVKNGLIEFTQDPIRIGNLDIILVPQIIQGAFDSEQTNNSNTEDNSNIEENSNNEA